MCVAAERSGSQRIELVCGRRNLPVEAVNLRFFDHMHSFDTGQQDARNEQTESQAWVG